MLRCENRRNYWRTNWHPIYIGTPVTPVSYLAGLKPLKVSGLHPDATFPFGGGMGT